MAITLHDFSVQVDEVIEAAFDWEKEEEGG
jgi:hypothetical protein